MLKPNYLPKILFSFLLLLVVSTTYGQSLQRFLFTFPITKVEKVDDKTVLLQLNYGTKDGIYEEATGQVFGLYDKDKPERNVDLGTVTVQSLSENNCTLKAQLKQAGVIFKGDVVRIQVKLPRQKEYSDVFNLVKHSIFLVDAKNQATYSRTDVLQNDGPEQLSQVIRVAQRETQEMGRFNKTRFDSLKVNYGKYTGLSLYRALQNVKPQDIKSFIRYMDAVPNRYMGRNVDVGLEIANWIFEGAPMSYGDLAEIFLLAKSPVEVDRLQKTYNSYITKEVLAYWAKLVNYYHLNQKESNKAAKLNELTIRFYKLIGTPEEVGARYYYQAEIKKSLKEIDEALKANANAQEWLSKTDKPQNMLECLQQKASILEASDRKEETITAFEACLAYHTKHPTKSNTTKLELAEICQKLTMYAEAEGNYEKSVGYLQQKLSFQSPDDGGEYGLTLAMMGFANDQLNKKDKALDYYKQALTYYDTTKSDQKYSASTVYKNIGSIYYNRSNYDEALSYYRPAIVLSHSLTQEYPGEESFVHLADLLELTTDVLMEKGDKEGAFTSYQQLYELRKAIATNYPSESANLASTRALKKMSDVNAKVGKGDEALKFFEERIAKSKASGDKDGEASALADMAMALTNNGNDYDKAIETAQEALKLYETLDNKAAQGNLLAHIGKNYSLKGDETQALHYYEKALSLKQEVATANPSKENQNMLAWAYDPVADAYYKLGKGEKAADYYQKRIDLHKKAGEPQEVADAYWDLGINASDVLNDYEAAITAYEIAIITFKRQGNTKAVGSLYRNIALNYSRLDDYQNALKNYKESYTIRKKIADEKQDSTAHCNLAQVLDGLADMHSELGDYEAALKWQQERIPIYEHYDNELLKADAYWDLGVLYGDKLNDYHKAIDYYQKAILIYEEDGKEDDLAILYNNISLNYSQLYQYDKALEYNNKALVIHQALADNQNSIDYQREIADDLKDIGYRYSQMEEYEKAEEKLLESLALAKKIYASTNKKADAREVVSVYDKLSDNYFAKGELDKAFEMEEERLSISQEIDAKDLIASSYFKKGYIKNRESKDYDKATEYYEKAYDAYLASGDTSNAVITRSNIGANYSNLLNYDEAIKNHLAAIDLAEKIQDHEKMGYSYSRLAKLYQQTGDPKKSLEAYNKSINALNDVNDKGELMEAFTDLASLYRNNQDLPKALEYYEKTLELARLANNRKEEGNMLYNIADTYFQKNDYKNAEIFYRKSLKIREEINDKKGQAYSLTSLGLIEIIRNDFDKASTYYNEAIATAQKVNDKEVEAFCQRGLAHLLINQGKYNEAEQTYLTVLAYYTETNNYKEQVNTVLNIAWLYAEKGDFYKALEMYEEGYQIAKKASYKQGIANANTGQAEIYRLLGDFEKAWEIQQKSLKLYEEDDNPWGIAGAYINLGNIKNMLGDYETAIAYYERSDSLFKSLGNEYNRATPLNNIGNLYYWQGDYEKALSYFEKAADILDRLKVKDAFRATVDGNIAEIYYKQKRYDEAEKLILNSLSEGRKFDDKDLIASNLDIIGRAKMEQKLYDESEAYLDEAYKTVKNMRSKASLAWVSASLGKLYFRMQEYSDATKFLDESLQLSTEIGSSKYKWEVLYHKGLIAKQQKKLDESKGYLIEAMKVLEALEGKVIGGDDAKKLFIAGEEKVKVYSALIDVLLEKGEVKLAQEILDRNNNETIRNQFKQLNIEFEDERKNRALKTEKELKAKLDNIENELSKEKSKGNGGISADKIEKLEATKSIAEEKYIKFVTETFRSNPSLSQHFSKSINPIELKTDKNKRLIPKDVTMVSYLPGKDKLYIFAATSDTVIARIVSISRADLVKKINFLSNFSTHHITGAHTDPLQEYDPATTGTDFDATNSQFKTVSEELYQYLIAPIEQEIASRTKVGIIPSGMLHLLPFQLLGKKATNGKFTYLIEQHTIFYANSLKMLERFVSPKKELKVLAFGNADNSLPAAEKEVNTIKDLYPNSQVYIKEAATENLVKEASEQYNVLHFATHGTLDFSDFQQSYLVLAADAAKGEDGKLTIEEVWEIESLYNYKLVTLSACQTAISEKEGSWPVSPATSFIDAGANTVVASLWSVDDGATALLMKYFYENLQTMEKGEALRKAQLQLGQQKAYSHPYYWAPFILIGDWR